MTLYCLKQLWNGKPYGNLSVSCDFCAAEDAVKAVFYITEPSVKAVWSETNQKVYEDSCAELFLSFGNGFYYNFEVSCIGTVLAQYGENRFNREFLKPEIIREIVLFSTLGRKPFGVIGKEMSYRLEIKIPKSVFVFDGCRINHESLVGNIYKCADKSPTPHYMSLFDVVSEKPDFHRPEFFKRMG